MQELQERRYGMKGKDLLKQIEQACLNNHIDYRDLIDLGIDLQRRKQDILAKQLEEMRRKQDSAILDIIHASDIIVRKSNWN